MKMKGNTQSSNEVANSPLPKDVLRALENCMKYGIDKDGKPNLRAK